MSKAKKVKDSCSIGDTGELAFMLAAVSRGLTVAMPYGHGSPYDVIVDVGGTLIKIQIKTSEWHKTRSGGQKLEFNLNTRGRPIVSIVSKFDVLVGYDITNKDFYIIPAKNITTSHLSFSSKAKPYIFKNNWDLLTKVSTK